MIDIVMIIVCVVVSYMLRFEFNKTLVGLYLQSMYWMIGVCLVVKLAVYYRFGLYRHLWAYASVDELRLIALSVATGSVLSAVVMLILNRMKVFPGFPRSALIIDFVLSLLAVGAPRFAVRAIASRDNQRAVKAQEKFMNRALIVGAGDAGAIVCREVLKNPQLKFELGI